MNHDIRWTFKKITERLNFIKPLVYREQSVLPPFRHLEMFDQGIKPQVEPAFDDSTWEIIRPPAYWGSFFANFVLRTTFQMPEKWSHSHPVALVLPLGTTGSFSHPEALVYIDGESFAACDRHHPEILLEERWCDGQEHHLALHGFCGWQDNFQMQTFMQPCFLASIDTQTRDFIAAVRIALGIVEQLDQNDLAHDRLLNGLDEAFKVLDLREPIGEKFYASVPFAARKLKSGVAKAGVPMDISIIAAGHAHIDVAWLWPLAQTRRKTARTFHNVIRLMEQFPEYHFTQSQPQLYEFVRQDHPGLFETIQQKVKKGTWEPIGGMWVEADCNISGGESLARQLILGRNYFRQHFGKDAESPVLWLPDVFGYSWSLPQLAAQAGLKFFFTVKLSWNQYNHIPYDSFWWQGLDGTRILTHLGTTLEEGFPSSTYNASVTPCQVMSTWRNFQQKELSQDLLMAYGYGDGGGGPTREMLENIRELAAFPSAPHLTPGKAGNFFRRLEASCAKELPVWNAELYFELHRGTYTTQARNKRANRKAEFALHDAEFLAATAYRMVSAYEYPTENLTNAWKLVCLNQFHDIIPGSSIGEVYEESLSQYAAVQKTASEIKVTALDTLARLFGGDLLLVNPTSFSRNDLAFLPGEFISGNEVQDSFNETLPVQVVEGGILIAPGVLEPYSLRALQIKASNGNEPAYAPAAVDINPHLLENPFLRIEFNSAGDMIRIFDKENNREIIPAGAIANQFQAFEDRPLNWDAWDIDIFYSDKMWLAEPADSIQVIENGPLRAALQIKRRVLNSIITQHISLAYNSRRVEFETQVEWNERHILLKVAFPVEVFSPEATYEIQWGNVQRPTHINTSWDWARFETCAHKWVDLSEGGYGVSLLNDCKYGHDIHENIIRLTLLRGPTLPDPQADQGEHTFTYSLLPHPDRWNEGVVCQAYMLNDPIIVHRMENHKDPQSESFSLVRLDAPSLVVETIKKAEQGDSLIFRLYESQRMRGTARIKIGLPIKGAWRTNLLEEDQEELVIEDNQIVLSYKPYEIISFRVVQ